ncbi:hypothetical protein CGZ96_08120 [Enemella evansiae]|nr:hypothetical protein CGZ95_14300 [Enemella evansiae]OYN99435.1 hypothetical protein CGZ96_08120 [Enemella evansiae]
MPYSVSSPNTCCVTARAYTRPVRALISLLVDVLLVLGFTLAMRVSHSQAITPLGLIQTAWPFLVGLAIGWLVSRSWRTTLTLYAALAVWACTVGIGLVIRRVTMVGVQPSFTMVAASVLAVFLLGWRLIVFLVREVNRRQGPIPGARPSA